MKERKKKKEVEWTKTIHAAVSLGCSVQTLYRWTTMKGFPDSAVKRDRWGNLYDVEAVRAWALARLPNHRGRPFIQVITA